MAMLVLALVSLVAFSSGATHTVQLNHAPVWTVGVGLSYPDITISLGETLSFTSSSSHDVAMLTPPSTRFPWNLCTMKGIPAEIVTSVFATSDFGTTNVERHYTPPTCGEFYFACSVGSHCVYGQRVKVTVTNVDGSACRSPCTRRNCVQWYSTQTVSDLQSIHAVAPALPAPYWGSTAFYNDITVNVGDHVLFQTAAGFHDVATLPDHASYSTCTMINKVILAEWDANSGDVSSKCTSSNGCCMGSSCGKDGLYATYTYTATSVGSVYFACSVGGSMHCGSGQKFKLTVTDRRAMPSIPSTGARTADATLPSLVFVLLTALFASM